MIKNLAINEYIKDAIQSSGYAVLATEGNGQPHTSLIAITPFENFRQLIFATYRNTIKYRNLEHNNKVALLIENAYTNEEGHNERSVVTIIGHTKEISSKEKQTVYQAHLKRHPEMESFMLSSDCSLFLVIAQSYQVVYGIDEIKWITADDLALRDK
jgi:uncharacterized pyridoxamine 5'-phosphate oxidase family protein